jgi:hypothetical protein
VSVS